MALTGNEPLSVGNVATALGVSASSCSTGDKPISAENLKTMMDAQDAERSKTARLEDMSWSQLKEISDATNADNLDQMVEKYKHLMWQRKDVHVVYPNGRDFYAICACIDMGKDVDENGKPVLFTFAMIYEHNHAQYANGSYSGGWDKSTMRTDLNGVEANYYKELTPYVTPVQKKNTPEFGDDTIDKYWIPSATEMCIPVNSGDYTDKVALGNPYSWFENYKARDPKNFDLFTNDNSVMTRSSYTKYSYISISNRGASSYCEDYDVNYPSILCFCI